MNSSDLLWLEDHFGAVNKPGGVLTQAPPGIDSVELRLRRWRDQQARPQATYIGMPHRLDRPASGVLLFGLSRATTRKLAEQFERRAVDKYYWCVVAGSVAEEEGQWSDWMRKVPDEARSEIVSEDHPDAQLAVLRYRVLGCSSGLSWLRIQLETGRTHQIRLQAASRGFPICGDSLYGSRVPFGPETTDERSRWIALHARKLSFSLPGRAGRPLAITAPLFHHWDNLAAQFAGMTSMDV